MAKQTLPTNFQDDVLNEVNPKRKYKMIMNDDATVSFEDVTEYDQVGSNFGAAQVNETNTAVNESADKSDIIDSTADVLANTASGKMASALAVKGLADYTPMQPSKNYTGDLNDLPTGVFNLDPSKCTNTPSHMMGMWAHVICRKNYSQTVLFYSTVGLPVVAFRSYASNAWTPWKEQGIGHGFGDVWQNGLVKNALLVNLNDPYAVNNKTYYVDRAKGTDGLPSDCQWGIREGCWLMGNWVMVRITGWSTDGQYAMWTNVYVSSNWQGWDRFSKSEPHVLWTGTGAFDAPTLTLNKKISFFKYYEIIYEVENGNNTVKSTGRIPIGNGATLDGINGKGLSMRRTTSAPSGTSLKLNSGGYWSAMNTSSSPYSGACCPRRIIGYV